MNTLPISVISLAHATDRGSLIRSLPRRLAYSRFALCYLLTLLLLRPDALTVQEDGDSGASDRTIPSIHLLAVAAWGEHASEGARPTPNTQAPLIVRLEEKEKGMFGTVTSYADAARSILFALVLVGLASYFLVTVVRELRRDAVVIDPINTPEDLARKGYTSDIVARRIAAELGKLQQAARFRLGREEDFELSASQIDFTVPTAGVSYRSIIRYIRQSLRRPEQRLQGEITKEGETIRIVLRARDHGTTSTHLCVSSERDISDLLKRAAFEAASLVNPYLIANYWLRFEEKHGGGFEKTIHAVRQCLQRRPVDQHHRAYLIWGNALMLQRNYQGAEEKYRMAISLAKCNRGLFSRLLRSFSAGAAIYNSWGIVARNQRRLEEAAQLCRRAIRCDRRYVYAHANLGYVLNDRRRYGRAMRSFRRAARLDPMNASAWNGWGFALWKLGNSKEAVSKFARAIDVDSRFGWSYLNWARLLMAQHRYDAAIKKVRLAAEQRLLSAQAYALWGDILVNALRFDEAERMYGRAIAADSTLANGLVGMASLRRNQHNYRAAIRASRKAARLDHYNLGGLSNLAVTLRLTRRYRLAVKTYKRVLKLEPDRPGVYADWGELLSMKRELEDAAKQFEVATRIDPSESWPWRSWGRVLKDMNRCEEAIEKLQKAIDLDPFVADGYVGLGESLLRLGRLREAEGQFRRALEVDGRNGPGWRLLAETLIEVGRREDALLVVERAIKEQPGIPAVLVNSARVWRIHFQEPEKSAALCEEAIRINGRNVDALIELALASASDDRRLELLTRAVAMAPWTDWAWRDLANHLFWMGRVDNAFDCFSRAHRRMPESIVILIGWSDRLKELVRETKAGNVSEWFCAQAAEKLRLATKVDRWSTWPLINWGYLLLNQGEADQAMTRFKKALQLDPWSSSAWEGKGDAFRKSARLSEAEAAYVRAQKLRPKEALNEKLASVRKENRSKQKPS